MSRAIILLLLLLSTSVHGAIGKITEDRGSAEVQRQKSKLSAQAGLGIESMDSVETANGIVGITFQDNTQVRVTEHSKLVIDDFVYDPKVKGAGKLALNVAMGTVRYASGNIAHENNKNVAINTPTATVAVRGTAFTMTVDEIGQSLIILLPNRDGSVGEIEVTTVAGQVVLNQAFQATFTTNIETKPSRPAILNLTESAIDNMLIVRPPREIVKEIMAENRKQRTALTFDDLDKNALEIKPEKPALAFNELDVNELNIDYLNNALDNYILAVFVLGYNANTQTYIFDRNTYYQITRNTTQKATVLINKDRGYDITIIQDGQTVNIQNQESTTNSIFIKQSK